MMDTFTVLRDILAYKFEKDLATITPDATLATLDIDSLDTVDLLFELEDKFDIKVSNDQANIKTLQDVVDLIDRLRTEQGKHV